MVDRKVPNSAYAAWFENKARSVPVYNPNAIETYIEQHPTKTFLLELAKKTKEQKKPYKIYHLRTTRDTSGLMRTYGLHKRDEATLRKLFDEADTELLQST